MKRIPRWIRIPLKVFISFVILILLSITTVRLITEPSNSRTWTVDQEVLPYADINGDLITIHNVRNFDYATTTVFTPGYYDKTYDVSKLKKVWYIVSPFAGVPGSAHTFLSFEFEDGVFVTNSIEIRKEVGESFNPFKALFNKYEIMYVWADEKDTVKLRSNYRQDKVYVYPLKLEKEKAQKLFINMISKTNELYKTPEFYNIIVNTCMTSIVKQLNMAGADKVSYFHKSILFPENSDLLFYEQGLIDTDVPEKNVRQKFLVNSRALEYASSSDFSVKIR